MKKRRTSRRKFFKNAFALSFPLLIPASVLGRNNNIAPSDRINLAFIGLGNRGFRWTHGAALIQNFITYNNCEIRALCDVDRNYLQDAKVYVDDYYGHKDCATYTDFREILIREDIDGLVMATPHHWHAHMTVLACEHGKDVYIEKPMSNSVEESIAMVSAARRYGRIVQVGSQARSSRKLNFACRKIREGKIGEIKEILVGCFGPPVRCNLPAEPTPDFIDWDMFLGPAAYRPYHSRLHRGASRYLGGGSTTDIGHHFLDIAQWGLGTDHTGPIEVFPAEGKDYDSPTLKYANGTILHVKSSRMVGEGTTFFGTKGKIYIHAWDDIVRYDPPALRYEFYHQTRVMKYATGEILLLNNHLENFLECMRTRQKPNADVAIGCNSVNIAHLANIFYWVKRPLQWDPAKRAFINDESANRYLSKSSRVPWRL